MNDITEEDHDQALMYWIKDLSLRFKTLWIKINKDSKELPPSEEIGNFAYSTFIVIRI